MNPELMIALEKSTLQTPIWREHNDLQEELRSPFKYLQHLSSPKTNCLYSGSTFTNSHPLWYRRYINWMQDQSCEAGDTGKFRFNANF